MMALVLWWLAAFGFAFVVGHSKISLPFRQWAGGWIESRTTNDLDNGQVLGRIVSHKPAVPVLGPLLVALVECPGCLGWWLGFIVGLTCPMLVVMAAPSLMEFSGSLSLLSAVVLSFSTSAVNLLLAKYVGML